MSAIVYANSAEGLRADQLVGFFEGWPNPPSPETHLQILQRSAHVVLARELDTGRVIGFVNALSDGVLSAYIPLLEVLPEYRGRGIGTELVRRILAEMPTLYQIDVVCDASVVLFYQRLGLRPGHSAMMRRFEYQCGAR